MTAALHKQCDINYKLLEILQQKLLKIHSAQHNCCRNIDIQTRPKSLIFVKCEQHTTKRHKLNLGSTVITWSAIGYWFSFSATSVTCDILSFKTCHFISTTKYVRCDSVKEIPFYRTSWELTMFWKDFLEFLSWIKTHPIQTSHLILLTLTFVLSSNQYVQHSQYSD